MARRSGNSTTGLVLGGLPRVNLLPPSVTEKRLQARLTKRWAFGLAATLLVVGVISVGAYGYLATTVLALQQEQDRTIQLTAELATYSDVTNTLTERDDLNSFRAEAMGNDLAWKPVLDAVAKKLPSGVTLHGFELKPGANPVAEPDRTRAVGLTAVLTLWSKNPIDQDKVVDNLRTLEYVIDANASTLQEDTSPLGGYGMAITFVANQTVYSGKYTEGAGK